MLVVYNQLLNKLFNVIVEIKLIISFKTNSKQNVWIKGIKINFNFEIIWYLSVQCNPPPNVQSDKLRNTKLLWPTLSRNDLIVENVVQLLRTNGICMEHYQDQYVQGHTMAETVELLYSKTLVGLGWMSHFWVFTLIWRISEQFRIRKKKIFNYRSLYPIQKPHYFRITFLARNVWIPVDQKRLVVEFSGNFDTARALLIWPLPSDTCFRPSFRLCSFPPKMGGELFPPK